MEDPFWKLINRDTNSVLENKLFQLILLNIEFLGTMNSKKYGQVDVDLGYAMASLKLH